MCLMATVCTTVSLAILTAVLGNAIAEKQCEPANICMILEDCTVYTKVIKPMEKPLSAPVVSFLRSQQCGFDMGYPKVCCSDLPEYIRTLKSSRPQYNKYTNATGTAVTCRPRTTTSRAVSRTSKMTEATTTNYVQGHGSKGKKKKFSDFSEDFFDYYIGSFDLVFRTKRFEPSDYLHIEIR